MPKKQLLFLLSILFPLMFFSISLSTTGVVSFSISGFAVDSDGKMYIGKDRLIEVYDEDNLIQTIGPIPSRAYAFTIQENNTILLSTTTTIYEMSLQGDILNQAEDIHTQTFTKLQRTRKSFTAKNGNQYQIKSYFGRYVILQNSDRVVYQMPVLDYVAKCAFFLSILGGLVFIPVIVWKWRKTEISKNALQ